MSRIVSSRSHWKCGRIAHSFVLARQRMTEQPPLLAAEHGVVDSGALEKRCTTAGNAAATNDQLTRDAKGGEDGDDGGARRANGLRRELNIALHIGLQADAQAADGAVAVAADRDSSGAAEAFVPALGVASLPAVYEKVVDLFCRDNHVKSQLLARIAGRNDLHIVDVACGPGKLAERLASQQPCCTVSAFDIDPAMVAKARVRTGELTNVSVQVANVCALPLPDASCDVVIESLLFHHLTDAQKVTAISEIARVLRSHGTFYFVDWVRPSSFYATVAFSVIKLLDGRANVASHANNVVLDLIGVHFVSSGDPTYVQTTVGTLAIIAFDKLCGALDEAE